MGLLNFNDGRGYLQASLEYTLVASGESFRTDVYGLEPFTLAIPMAVAPRRGEGLRVDVLVDYGTAFSTVNLRDAPAAFVEGLVAGLLVVGVG